MESKENNVFKYLIIFTIIMSSFVIYFLMLRPLKVVITASDVTADPISFTYKVTDLNPDIETVVKRSEEGGHVIVVLLGPKRKLLTNQSYETMLKGFKDCNNTLPCEVLKIPKSEFDSKARDRKDLK